MKPNLLMTIILPVFIVCFKNSQKPSNPLPAIHSAINENPYPVIGAIPLPTGYSRIPVEKNSFGEWLRNIELKKNKTVYLYNKVPKTNQSAQFAVLNISVDNKDLQQCADAVMRLRAEYLYTQKRYTEICFRDNNNKNYTLGTLTDRKHFDEYLEKVFAMCGTLSLEKQLNGVHDISHLQPGDVLIHGGSPGHAMIVADMARNKEGKCMYILAQSYMPAQDIHIVINPLNNTSSPWYELTNTAIYTPEWVFRDPHFKTWP
jgi:uncharacterized protein DUF4846